MIVNGLNDYIYTVWDNKADMEAKGHRGGSCSVDGSLVISQNRDNTKPIQDVTPVKPSYVKGMAGWPYLSHKEALELTNYPEWRT